MPASFRSRLSPDTLVSMYRKVIVEAVVGEDDCEGVIQQLSEVLEALQKSTIVYRADIRDEEVPAPENAGEILHGN